MLTLQQRQSVQVIFRSVQGSGTEVWHTHIVPEVLHCCERLSLLSATEVFSLCNSLVWKITSPRIPAAFLLSAFSPVNMLTRPTESPQGKNRISWVIAPVLFPETWQQTGMSGFGIFPIPRFACPTYWKLNAIRRVWSSKWSLPKCYCFLNGVGEVYLWMCWNLPLAWLTLSTWYTDVNLKALAACTIFLLILDTEYYMGAWSFLIENGNESRGKSKNEIKVRELSADVSLRTANHKAPALVT